MEYPNEQIKSAYQTRFIDLMGVELIHCSDGRCELNLEVREQHKQHRGYVHGGILAGLIDHVGGTAAASLIKDERYVLTSDINVSYLKPALPPLIRFEGNVIKSGNTLLVSEVRVYNTQPEESLCTVGRLTLCVVNP